MSRFSSHSASSIDDGDQTKALVKWFNVAKGFGFVAPVDDAPDAFLHISVLNRAGLQELGDGAEIVCCIASGPKGPQVTRIIDVVSHGRKSSASTFGDDARGEGSGAPVGPVVALTGTVKWFKPDKGFGFVMADDGGKDVFIHKSVLRRCDLLRLDAGERVEIKAQEAQKGREATWVSLL